MTMAVCREVGWVDPESMVVPVEATVAAACGGMVGGRELVESREMEVLEPATEVAVWDQVVVAWATAEVAG
jgi:hypothetical protein